MSENKEKRSKKMVYTREQHIPIGEAVINENGEMALRVKKPKGPEMETITIGTLLSDIAKAVGYTS